jgi:non-ribosomal peptide synthetase component E (peptide arylation enzyme)
MALGTSPISTKPRLSIISGPSQPALLDWTFNDLLRDRLLRHHDNVAIISQHQGETLTYAGLNQRAERLAAALYGLGVKKDDRVGVLLGNRVEYAIVSARVILVILHAN